MTKADIKKLKDSSNRQFEKEWESFLNELANFINSSKENSEEFKALNDLSYSCEYIHMANSMIKKAKKLLNFGYEDFVNRAILVLEKFNKINKEINNIPVTKQTKKITELDKYYEEIQKRSKKKQDFVNFALEHKNFGAIIEDGNLIINNTNYGKDKVEVGIKIGMGDRVHYALVQVQKNEINEYAIFINRRDRFYYSNHLFIIDIWENIPEHLKAYHILENETTQKEL